MKQISLCQRTENDICIDKREIAITTSKPLLKVMHNRFLAMQKQQQAMAKGETAAPRQSTTAFQEDVRKKAQVGGLKRLLLASA